MTDAKQPEAKAPPKPRGEAAWKVEKDRIAARNQEARKAGKAQRKEHEQRQSDERRVRERADLDSVRDLGTSRS